MTDAIEGVAAHRTRRILLVILAIGIVALIGLRMLQSQVARSPALPVLGSVPVFSFTDQNGAGYGSSDLENKVWVASFIYTSCPGPCPRLVTRVKSLERRFSGEPDFALVSFSVDPQQDTVEALAEYVKTHGIDSSVWHLLTGPPESLLKIIREGFFLAVARTDDVLNKLDSEQAKAAIDPEQGPITHSVRLALVDRAGDIRGFYDSNEEADLRALGTAIAVLINSSG